MPPLSEQEVNQLYTLLSEIQIDFLDNYLKQSKKSKWLEKLAHKKGIVIGSDMSMDEIWDKVNDWRLDEILDGGFGKRPYKCECGMPLRFCYVVHHAKDNKTYRLGETCLGNYTMLSPELIKDITHGFHTIDLERDDILKKYRDGWGLPDEYERIDLPEQLLAQIDVGLPLSSAQIKRIESYYLKELHYIRKELRSQRNNQSLRSAPTNSSNNHITFDELMSRHLGELKSIRSHETKIEHPLKKRTWLELQASVKELKSDGPFNYSKFLSQMFELLYYLKLY